VSDLKGGNAADNAKIIERVFAGERGSARDIVLLNAGAILYLAGRVISLEAGVIRAAELIDDGYAAGKLAELRQFTGGKIHAS
jgi:anthranilate phosphoribosyltransferase